METSDKIDPKNFEAMPNQCIKSDAVIFWSKFGFDIQPIDPLTLKLSSFDEDSPQSHFEQFPNHVPAAKLPPGFIAVGWTSDDTNNNFLDFLKSLVAMPLLWLKRGSAKVIIYKLAPDMEVPSEIERPDGINIYRAGSRIMLPYGDDLEQSKIQIDTIDDIPVLSADLFRQANPIKPTKRNRLDDYSLLGSAESLAETIADMRPLLGKLCYSGQATVFYAPPNAGKTLLTVHLLIEAIEEGRLQGRQVYYINADDTASGLIDKMRLTDDVGVNVIAPGYKGFECRQMIELLTDMAADREADGVLVIFDTLKKFTDLMNKREASLFTDACRKFVMAGGSILGLAHTTKHAKANGKLQYAGTTDLIDDFDAAYILSPLDENVNQKVVVFECQKSRGAGTNIVAYAFDNRGDTVYVERLASVREVDADQIDIFQRVAEQTADDDIISAIKLMIAQKPITKMVLAKAVAGKVGSGKHTVVKIIDRYSGTDPDKHYWNFTVGDRGAKTFYLLGPSDTVTAV